MTRIIVHNHLPKRKVRDEATVVSLSLEEALQERDQLQTNLKGSAPSSTKRHWTNRIADLDAWIAKRRREVMSRDARSRVDIEKELKSAQEGLSIWNNYTAMSSKMASYQSNKQSEYKKAIAALQAELAGAKDATYKGYLIEQNAQGRFDIKQGGKLIWTAETMARAEGAVNALLAGTASWIK